MTVWRSWVTPRSRGDAGSGEEGVEAESVGHAQGRGDPRRVAGSCSSAIHRGSRISLSMARSRLAAIGGLLRASCLGLWDAGASVGAFRSGLRAIAISRAGLTPNPPLTAHPSNQGFGA